jgi:T5SS/PEP-CTERM-associated repeat protein
LEGAGGVIIDTFIRFSSVEKTMSRSTILLLVLAAMLCLLVPLPAARAAVTATGDVSPNPVTSPWDISTLGYIGNTVVGTLTVDGGSNLNGGCCVIGNAYGSTGQVTVDGANSALSLSHDLTLGNGNATLTIECGAVVTAPERTDVNQFSSGATINFGPGGAP